MKFKETPEPLSSIPTGSLRDLEKQIRGNKDLMEKNWDYLKMINDEIERRVNNIL